MKGRKKNEELGEMGEMVEVRTGGLSREKSLYNEVIARQ